MPSEVQRLAAEVFLTAAGPALVKRVAEILGEQGIPVMPLKGVLLQKLVYGDDTFRPISDVDLLVPKARFFDAHAALLTAGFSKTKWEGGGWQVVMRNPSGPPLAIDLHRRLTRTIRSGLTAEGLFERGVADTRLFGVGVILPCGDDLFAHLLLHAMLHFINVGGLHRPEDFQAVADAMALDAERCAAHLGKQGLAPHALVMLPLLREATAGTFIEEVASRLNAPLRARAAAHIVQAVCGRFIPGHPCRRLAGAVLAPSLTRAVASATWDRVFGSLRR